MRSGALIWISRRRRLTLDQTERTMNDSVIVIKFFTWTSLRLQVSDRKDIVFWFVSGSDRQTDILLSGEIWSFTSAADRQRRIFEGGLTKTSHADVFLWTGEQEVTTGQVDSWWSFSWERSLRLKLNLNDCIISNKHHIKVESTIDQMVIRRSQLSVLTSHPLLLHQLIN